MTNRKTSRDEALALLTALHDLARMNQASDVTTAARRLGWGIGRVYRVLGHLDDKGVADRDRCRLTMAGLALAVALRAAPAHASQAA